MSSTTAQQHPQSDQRISVLQSSTEPTMGWRACRLPERLFEPCSQTFQAFPCVAER